MLIHCHFWSGNVTC